MASVGIYNPPGAPYPYAANAGIGDGPNGGYVPPGSPYPFNANAGTGAVDPAGLGDYFLAPTDPGLVPVSGLGKVTAISGLGITPGNPRAITAVNLAATVSPALGALRDLSALLRPRGTGLGEDLNPVPSTVSPNRGFAIALVLGMLAVRAGAGYIAGRAMAPNSADRNAYGWGGLLGSVFLGTLGIGITGAVALSKGR